MNWRWSQRRCMVRLEKKKKIYGFEWLNQELVGRGVEPMMAEVELTMREIGDGWRRKPEWFSVSGL